MDHGKRRPKRWTLRGQAGHKIAKAIRLTTGGILVVAGVMKGVSWSAVPTLPNGAAWWGVLAFLELLGGIWLVSGFCSQWSVPCAAIFFGALTGYNVYAVWDEWPGCRCFGTVSLRPIVALLLDSLVALSLY